MERIMIIDSDLNQMKQLKDSLAGEYLTLGCNRGTNAMDLFKIFQPNALILDPSTHELNGKAFIRKIKAIPYRGDIPILALARISTLQHIEETFNLGADMIFSKPCSPDRVKHKLRHYFAQGEPKLETARS